MQACRLMDAAWGNGGWCTRGAVFVGWGVYGGWLVNCAGLMDGARGTEGETTNGRGKGESRERREGHQPAVRAG